MNRLVIIGNGFDLAHGLKTSYADFLEWYKIQKVKKLQRYENDYGFCTLEVDDVNNFHISSIVDEITDIDLVNRYKGKCIVSKSEFYKRIETNYLYKKWVDIEDEYYQLLKEIIFSNTSLQTKIERVSTLNKQLNYLKQKLAEFLSLVQNERERNERDEVKEIDLVNIICSNLDIYDEVEPTMTNRVELENKGSHIIEPEKIKIINFNYTNTVEDFCEEYDIDCSYIHGNLSTPESIIFGYGDELDENFKLISNYNENEYLRNFKTFRYLESGVYRDVLRFIESGKYQILILGHSCGNSDRTLLNTLFNHKNCISIKPYYYRDDKGWDNYSDIIMNISRNFNDSATMRSKVVDKEHCQLLK